MPITLERQSRCQPGDAGTYNIDPHSVIMASVRNVALVVAATALASTTFLIPVAAAPIAQSADGVSDVGQLVYVTQSGALDLADIASDGSVTSSQQIGPVTTAPSGGSVTVFGPVVSSDGQIAWTEDDQSASRVASWIVVRPADGGQPERISTTKSSAGPLGFVGSRLVLSNFDGKAWVMQPGGTPTLKLIASSQENSYFGTDSAGIVYEHGFAVPGKAEPIELLHLNGHSTPLHTFPGSMFRGQRAPLEQGWVDPDGKDAMFEQGDHTDFGGVGPISQAFSISGLHASSAARLGHPGGAKPIRRMEGASFGADRPYAVWATISARVPAGSVYAYTGGGWRLFAANSLVVAGNRAGAVITQPAEYVDAGVGAPAYDVKPTGNAVLHVAGATHTVPFEATSIAWLN